MSIGAVSSASSLGAQACSTFAKGKKPLDELEAALKAGDVEAAKAAFSQFQAGAPEKRSSADGVIGGKVDALGQALASGDLSAAQTAITDLKQITPSRIAPTSERPAGGPPRGGPPAGGGARGAGESKESEKKDLDDADTNDDGKVSFQEQIAYEQKLKARAEKEKAEAEKKRAEAANSSSGGYGATPSYAPSGYGASAYTAESSGLSIGTGASATSGAVDVVA